MSVERRGCYLESKGLFGLRLRVNGRDTGVWSANLRDSNGVKVDTSPLTVHTGRIEFVDNSLILLY